MNFFAVKSWRNQSYSITFTFADARNCYYDAPWIEVEAKFKELAIDHYSQVKLKTLLSMSNFTHFLPRYQLKYDSICSFIIEKKLFGTSLSSRERRNN